MSKRLVLTDTDMGVKVYVGTDQHNLDGSWWVQFIGPTKWGRRLYQPSALDLEITSEGARVRRLVVQEDE